MPRTTTLDSVPDVRVMLAQLLYASPLPLAEDVLPTPEQVRPHVRTFLQTLGLAVCEHHVHAEFGSWPKSAAARMRAALAAVADAYPSRMFSRTVFTRRALRSPAEPSAYVPAEQWPAAWSEMARTLAASGMTTADIAVALAVDEPTVLRLLGANETGAVR